MGFIIRNDEKDILEYAISLTSVEYITGININTLYSHFSRITLGHKIDILEYRDWYIKKTFPVKRTNEPFKNSIKIVKSIK